jgi:hypothetical protein
MKHCHWRRRIILTLKINPQNWPVIEGGNSQFRNSLKSLQSAAHELQARQVPNKAQWIASDFPSPRAQEEVPFSANFRKCAPPLLNI